MLRHYEIAVIFHPDLDEAALAAQIERVEGMISADGGSLVRTDRWGKRRLAYEIRKKREGYYVFWYAALPPDGPQEIERSLRLTEDVMRFMLTRLEAVPEGAPEVKTQESEPTGPAVDEDAATDDADAPATDDKDDAEEHDDDDEHDAEEHDDGDNDDDE